MQRILAIVWLTWKAALRFKLFLVIAVLLLAAVIGLPLLIEDDGTARGFTQIILTYTLSAVTGLLGISTLWLSCGTLARDITFLNIAGAEKSLATPLLSAVKPSNDEHKLWVRRKLMTFFPELAGVTIAVWGLTYKPGTDTLRRSMAVRRMTAKSQVRRLDFPSNLAVPSRIFRYVVCKTSSASSRR